MLTRKKAPVQVKRLSASVLLCRPRPRAAAAAAVVHTVLSESHSRALNHRPQTDSCVVLGKENIQMLEESGNIHPVKEGFLNGCLIRQVVVLLPYV